MKELVIKPLYPGLGDHLIFSPVPRIAKKLGYGKVYINNSLEFRDPSIKYYIWECNPYVDGFTDKSPTFIDALSCRRPWHEEWGFQKNNPLDNVLKSHGLDDGRLWHAPEVYFKPKIFKKFEGANLFDPNFVHLWKRIINPSGWKEKIRKWFKNNRVKIDYQIKSDLYNGLFLEGVGKELKCSDFLEYSSVVKSCNRFYCMGSGSAFLAVALGQRPVVFHLRQFRKKPALESNKVERDKNYSSESFGLLKMPLALFRKLAHNAKVRMRFHLTKPKALRECTYITISSY